jgi:hypothetical protein
MMSAFALTWEERALARVSEDEAREFGNTWFGQGVGPASTPARIALESARIDSGGPPPGITCP